MFRVGSRRALVAFVRVQYRGQFARNTKYPRGVCECGESYTATALVLCVSLIFPPPLFLAEFDVCYSVLTTSRHIYCISYLRRPPLKSILILVSSASKFGMFA